MRKEIDDPKERVCINLHRPYDVRIMTVMAKVMAKSGVKVARSGVIDHLLSTMDITQTANEIAAKVSTK